jgi:hypothetical protein
LRIQVNQNLADAVASAAGCANHSFTVSHRLIPRWKAMGDIRARKLITVIGLYYLLADMRHRLWKFENSYNSIGKPPALPEVPDSACVPQSDSAEACLFARVGEPDLPEPEPFSHCAQLLPV